MNPNAGILCPVDFSDASLVALRYGHAIAEHFGARLVILTVEDPLLTEAMDLGTGTIWEPDETRQALARFANRAFGTAPLTSATVEYPVEVGKPAHRILHAAQEKACDLIVMSTHAECRRTYHSRQRKSGGAPVAMEPDTQQSNYVPLRYTGNLLSGLIYSFPSRN